jgi:hypothetical protein
VHNFNFSVFKSTVKGNNSQNYSTHLVQCSLVGSDAFDEGNRERVDLVRLVGLVDDGEGNAEAERLEVADFLVEGDDLGEEVDLQLQDVAAAQTGSGRIETSVKVP